ncbi:hypothetical protein AB833_05055 [Chromatiales bacterium (ex Bugula neritina AB1)]|nr:hypothetical protein AB833_05055 [Chromatiales bacterium (ex Bugula neritina AB1)]
MTLDNYTCRNMFYAGISIHKSYKTRQIWVSLKYLSLVLPYTDVFALECAAFAVMSNHYHLVLHIDLKTAASWSDDEVIQRWHQLFKGSLQSQRLVAGEKQDQGRSKGVKSTFQLFQLSIIHTPPIFFHLIPSVYSTFPHVVDIAL